MLTPAEYEQLETEPVQRPAYRAAWCFTLCVLIVVIGGIIAGGCFG